MCWAESIRALGRATPIPAAAPDSVSLPDVSWVSTPVDTTARKNAALCAAKDGNQRVQRLHRQKQQKGKQPHPLHPPPSALSLLLSPLAETKPFCRLDALLFELCLSMNERRGCLSCSVLESDSLATFKLSSCFDLSQPFPALDLNCWQLELDPNQPNPWMI